MGGEFQFGDILILGAIAAFILLRYRSMLGEKSGRDPEEIREQQARREAELAARVVQLPNVKDATIIDAKPQPAPHTDYPENLRDVLDRAMGIDPDFNAPEFLQGARSAFEMVLNAYRTRDRDALKMLLAPKLYEVFAGALAEEEAKGLRTENTLVAIRRADITEASLAGSQATITVAFTSDQIQLTRNSAGEIIEGDAGQEIEIEDRWVFTRDLRSQSPNWTIIDT
jgi:predicted lipid-binding transport protein (Tim44 family)